MNMRCIFLSISTAILMSIPTTFSFADSLYPSATTSGGSTIMPGSVVTGIVETLNTSMGDMQVRASDGKINSFHVSSALMRGRSGEAISIFNVQVGDRVKLILGTSNQVTKINIE